MIKRPSSFSLEPKYYGPFKIIKRRHPVYRVIDIEDNKNESIINLSRLNLYCGKEIPLQPQISTTEKVIHDRDSDDYLPKMVKLHEGDNEGRRYTIRNRKPSLRYYDK